MRMPRSKRYPLRSARLIGESKPQRTILSKMKNDSSLLVERGQNYNLSMDDQNISEMSIQNSDEYFLNMIVECILTHGPSSTEKLLSLCKEKIEDVAQIENFETLLNNSLKKGIEGLILKHHKNDENVWNVNDEIISRDDIPVEVRVKRKVKDDSEKGHSSSQTKKKKKSEIDYIKANEHKEVIYAKIKESKLTILQILITMSILETSNLEIKLESILDYIDKNQEYIVGKDINTRSTDPKRAILASLSKNASTNPLFVKGEDENYWKIGPSNIFYGLDHIPDGIMDYIIQSQNQSVKIELTELQKMIMRAIASENGKPCSLDKIYEYLKPHYENLKRRDGSSYASNAKRALQASLSNNSSNRPIFQSIEGENENDILWTLTERGEMFLKSEEFDDNEDDLSK